MSVKLIKLKCPDCGANLELEADREQAFCSYCGAKILLHNENEYIHRTIDEAEIEKAKATKEVRLKELEVEKTKTNLLKWAAIIYLTVVAVMVVVGLIGKAIGNVYLSNYLFIGELFFFLGIVMVVLLKGDSNKNDRE